MESAEILLPLPGSPGCFICDNNGSNPRALRLRLFWNEESRSVHIPCEPDDTWCGFDKVVHGGLVATVLDEAMAWAVKMSVGEWAFTADCNIRYKKAVEPGKAYRATAEVTENAGRKILAQAAFYDENGAALALAKAVFLPSKGKAKPRAVPRS